MAWPKNLKEMPAVKRVMTPFPYSVELAESLTRAQELMSRHGIHHLPVVDQGELIGVVSAADLERTLIDPQHEGRENLSIAEVPRGRALITDLSAPLDSLLRRMADERMEVALIVKDGRLAGIFTVTDACRHFAESLRQQFPQAGGDEAA